MGRIFGEDGDLFHNSFEQLQAVLAEIDEADAHPGRTGIGRLGGNPHYLAQNLDVMDPLLGGEVFRQPEHKFELGSEGERRGRFKEDARRGEIPAVLHEKIVRLALFQGAVPDRQRDAVAQGPAAFDNHGEPVGHGISSGHAYGVKRGGQPLPVFRGAAFRVPRIRADRPSPVRYNFPVKAVSLFIAAALGIAASGGTARAETPPPSVPAGPLRLIRELKKHEAAVTRIVLDRTGANLASSDSLNNVAVWKTEADEPVLFRNGAQVNLTHILPSADFTRITVAGCVEEIVLEATRWQVSRWLLPDGRKLDSVDGFTRSFDQLAVSPDVSRIALVTCGQRAGGVCQNPDLELMSVPGMTRLGETPGPRERITDLRFSPDGSRLLAAGCETVNFDRTCANPVMKMFRSRDGRELAALRPVALVNASSFTSDGEWLFTGSNEGSVELWDLLAKKPVRQFSSGKSAVVAAAISPDGRRLAWGTYDGGLWTWDPVAEKQPVRLDIHKGAVQALAFSGDSRRLASGGVDRTIRIFEIAGR